MSFLGLFGFPGLCVAPNFTSNFPRDFLIPPVEYLVSRSSQVGLVGPQALNCRVGSKKLEHGCRTIYAGLGWCSPHFLGFLLHGHVPTFWEPMVPNLDKRLHCSSCCPSTAAAFAATPPVSKRAPPKRRRPKRRRRYGTDLF